MSWSPTQYAALRESAAFSGLCAFRPRTNFSVASAGGGTDIATGQLPSENCFDVLGLQAQLGRLLSSADYGQPVAVIGDAFWRRHFDGDPHVVGRTLDLKDHRVTVVGVTPRGFHGLEPGRDVDVSLPLAMRSWVLQGPLWSGPNARWLRLIGRLGPGFSAVQAASEFSARSSSLFPAGAATARFELRAGAQGLNQLADQYSTALWLLMGAVSLLLLMGCANLASLMIARAESRDREVALRLALGASQGRVIRQLFTESLVLAAAGGTLGIMFAFWANRLALAILSRGRTPVVLDVGLAVPVLVFAVVVTVLASVLFGLWPAVAAVRRPGGVAPRMGRSSPAGASRRAGILVAAQTALSLVLLNAAWLFARSLVNLHAVDPGLAREDVFIVHVQPGLAGETAARSAQLAGELAERLSRTPGVSVVSQLQDPPLAGWSYRSTVAAPGEAAPREEHVHFNFVGARFFEALGIPLVAGRDIQATDDDRSQPVAIVSQALAARYFRGRSALGRTLELNAGPAASTVTIVGIARDIPYGGLRAVNELVLYRPFAQTDAGFGYLVVRASLPLSGVTTVARQALREIAPAVPLTSVTTMADQLEGHIATERLLAYIGAFLAVMALLLVAIGVYGTLAALLARQRRELGVRLALGATRVTIASGILARALRPVALGVAIGLPAAFVSARLADAVLFGIGSQDGSTYVACAGTLMAVTLISGAIPARSAARVDPMVELRRD